MTAMAHTAQLPVLNTGSLQSYLDSIQQIPVLSAEEEAELFQRFQTESDLEAARKLVLSHLRYVVYVARGYNGYGLPLDDIIHETLEARRLPGEGAADLVGLIRTLDAIGCTAPISVEVFSAELRKLPPVDAARRAAETTRAVLAKART